MSEQPRFCPWVGDNYGKQESIFPFRLMLLGESMYERDPQSIEADSMRNWIRDIAEGRWRYRFYSRVHRTVAPDKPVAEFWHSVVFYNYVQDLAGTRPRQRPAENAWESSRSALAWVIERHTPDAVLVLGKELFVRLASSEITSRSDGESGKLKIGKHPAEVAWIKQPSSFGFSSSTWHERVKRLVEKCRPACA